MVRLVLPTHEISEFDKCVQLSVSLARGHTAARHLASSAASVSSVKKFNTAPVRIKSRHAPSPPGPKRGKRLSFSL